MPIRQPKIQRKYNFRPNEMDLSFAKKVKNTVVSMKGHHIRNLKEEGIKS